MATARTQNESQDGRRHQTRNTAGANIATSHPTDRSGLIIGRNFVADHKSNDSIGKETVDCPDLTSMVNRSNRSREAAAEHVTHLL